MWRCPLPFFCPPPDDYTETFAENFPKKIFIALATTGKNCIVKIVFPYAFLHYEDRYIYVSHI